jgi:hypothetical protein
MLGNERPAKEDMEDREGKDILTSPEYLPV